MYFYACVPVLFPESRYVEESCDESSWTPRFWVLVNERQWCNIKVLIACLDSLFYNLNSQVSEESPPGSPSSSEEGDTSSSKGKKNRKRNKSVYKISISPNKSVQAKARAGKLRIKMIKVTKNEQGRLTVTGHREGSPSLEEENSSLEGNDSGTVDDHGQITCHPAVTAHTSRDNHVFLNGVQNLSQQQSPRDVSILSVVPMVTNPSMPTLSYQVPSSVHASATNVTPSSSSQFLPQNQISNAIAINQLAQEPSQNAGIQWNSVFVHPRVAELGSSPSSDYGSYMSDAGTRLSFSGSDSLSGGIPAQNIPDSDQCLFDGPFRVPLPVDRDSQSHIADSTKRDRATWSLTDCSPVTSQSSGNDVPVDMTDLAHLDSLEFDDMFDCDLSNVIPECFNDCLNSHPKDTSSVATTSTSLSLGSSFSTTINAMPQSPSLTSSYFTSGSQGDQQAGEFPQDTTSGLSSTTYVFVKPVSPVRSTVVTSCFVNVSKNTISSSYGIPAGGTNAQAPNRGRHECREVNMTDVSESRTVSQPSRSQVSLASSSSQLSNQHSTVPLPSDINNNPSRIPNAGKTAGISSTHLGNHVVPVSARITDFSPEWCYPEGGAKVLITGEWRMEQGTYTCLFDGCSVPAILYQSGVLRCFCPPHDPGLVTLQVACNGFIVSNACVFEYRARDSPVGNASCHEWLATDNDRFKLALLDRLERLESRLNASQPNNSENQTQGKQCMTFEDRLIVACEILQRATTSVRNPLKSEKPFRGMTLLHLSAALGYNRLVCKLLKLWRDSKSALVRDEVNPLRKDEFACTPLTWACALGQTDTALILLENEPKALLEPDARGRMPLQLARDRGFLDVVDMIEDFIMCVPNRWVWFSPLSSFSLFFRLEI